MEPGIHPLAADNEELLCLRRREKCREAQARYRARGGDGLRIRETAATRALRQHSPEVRARATAAMHKYRMRDLEKFRARDRAYAAKHRKEIAARRAIYYKSAQYRTVRAANKKRMYTTPSLRMRRLCNAAKGRAKARGLPYDSNLRDVLMAVPPTHCTCCGKAFDYSRWASNAPLDDSPSLDRFDNSKGYTVENTRVICFKCNSIKGDRTILDLEIVVQYMKGIR